jgi:hypothetical protein
MKKKVIVGVAALSALALLAGGLAVVKADSTSVSETSATSTEFAKGPGRNRPDFTNLTTAQQAALKAKMAERLKADQARQTAIQTALTNSDYSAWVTAEGTSSPLVAKITTANFSQYVQAYNLRQQADQILKSLGITGGQPGDGFGGEHGGPRPDGPKPIDTSSTTSVQ